MNSEQISLTVHESMNARRHLNLSYVVPYNGNTPNEQLYRGSYDTFNWDTFWTYVVNNNTEGFDRNTTTPFDVTQQFWQMTYKDFIWYYLGKYRMFENVTNYYDNLFSEANERQSDGCVLQQAYLTNSGSCECKYM